MFELREFDGLFVSMTLEQKCFSVTLPKDSSFCSQFRTVLDAWYREMIPKRIFSSAEAWRTPSFDVLVALGRANKPFVYPIILEAMKKEVRLGWADMVCEISGERVFDAFPEEFRGKVEHVHAYALGWVHRQVQGPYYDAQQEGRL